MKRDIINRKAIKAAALAEPTAPDAEVAEVKEDQIKMEIDRTGPYVHVAIPGFEGQIEFRLNGKKYGIYRVREGKCSIQLSGGLPREFRIEAVILKK
jgi:hypothetical protein